MKTVVCALNSQYVHSALAPWCLKAAADAWCTRPQEILVLEATVNQPEEDVIARLLAEKADVLAFCCYIWNWRFLERLLPRLAGKAAIVLGGPEVSFRASAVLEAFPEVTAVQTGEGERPFALLLDRLAAGKPLAGIPGLCCRGESGHILCTPPAAPEPEPPSPYTPAYLAALHGRIAYLETSRGCPFSCGFCLSGREDSVRFFGLERAKKELLLLANAGVQTVKLVDRTFNCHPGRAYELIRFILEQRGRSFPASVRFHFEVAADLFDEDTIGLLNGAPAGLFQLEAGLQSFHAPTLEAVTRRTDLDKLCGNLQRLIAPGNVHVHIDLIAGLPHENLEQFAHSFDKAYALQPHMLQLGFLKLLHGSRLRREAAAYGYRYADIPPYEVKGCPWMDEDDLARLHRLEDALERLYNSGRFRLTLAYVLGQTGLRPFALFNGLASYLHTHGVQTAGMALDAYTALVQDYFRTLPGVETARLRDVMACDSLASSGVGRLPPCLHVEDKRLGRIKRVLAAQGPKGARRGVAILYSLGERAVVAEYGERDPITNRYALRWAETANGGDAAGAAPPA